MSTWIERYGLRDVAGASIYVGVVRSVRPPADVRISRNSPIELSIERALGTGADGLRAGSTVPLAVYGGFAWHEEWGTPVDRRLDGAIEPRPGERVIAVPRGGGVVELLPAREDRLRVVSILWEPEAMAAWLSGPDAALAVDLADAELARLAAKELERRGALSVERLLAADESFLFELVQEMEPEPKLRFLAEAAALAKAGPARVERVFRLLTRDPRPAWIGLAAPLMEDVDPDSDAGPRLHADLRIALGIAADGVRDGRYSGSLDLSPFADALLAYERRRPRHAEIDDGLPALTAHMDSRAKAALARGFLDAVDVGGTVDVFLLSQAARLAREAPDASLLACLAAQRPGAAGSDVLVDAFVDIGASLFDVLPAGRVEEVVGPWLDLERPPSRATLARYAEARGRARGGDGPLPPGLLGFAEAERLARTSPGARGVELLFSLDPLKLSYSGGRLAMELLLDAGRALAAALPDERPRIQEAVQPWLDRKVSAPHDTIARYLEAVGTPPAGAPEAETFELSAGEAKRLPAGLYVRYEALEDGRFSVSFSAGRKGLAWRLEPAVESYREGWVAPYVVSAHRTPASGNRLRVALVPAETKPASMPDAEGRGMAGALAAKAGCPEHERHENRPWDGCFEYVASGPDGKRCVILIGTLTRAVIREA